MEEKATEMITDWIVAVSNIVIAIVAVFQYQIRSWLSRPKLRVSMSVSPPDCIKTILRQTFTARPNEVILNLKTDCYYFRFHIQNEGSQRAEYVEVFAKELSKQQADGSFKQVESFLPMNLLWSFNREPFVSAISPGMGKHCDLGHIIDPKNRKDFSSDFNSDLDVADDQVTFSLDVETPPSTKNHVIAPGKYRLIVLIGAGNIKPIQKIFEITFTGKWYDDERKMLGEGVGIKIT